MSAAAARASAAVPTLEALGFSITHAFQPIVDATTLTTHAYEALVRGPQGEPADWVFSRTPAASLPCLDVLSRLVAIETACRLGIGCRLNLNCSPRLFERSPRALDTELATARELGLAVEQLVIELTESDALEHPAALAARLDAYRAVGVAVAIDDFGAGYSGLNLLADFQPDEVKLDMNLVRGIAGRGPRQAIVRAILQACCDLGIDVIAEGVETVEEFAWLRDAGITLFQGYLFARPGWVSLPAPVFPTVEPRHPAQATP